MKQWRDKHDTNQHNNNPINYSHSNLWQSYYDSQKQLEQSRRNRTVSSLLLAKQLEQHYKICLALQLNKEADKAFQQACQIRMAEERKHWQMRDII
jgi:hypothetical protein